MDSVIVWTPGDILGLSFAGAFIIVLLFLYVRDFLSKRIRKDV